MINIKEHTDKLVEILEKKKEYLVRMLEFTKLQTSSIEQHVDDNMKQYLDEKQKMIERIDVLDCEFTKRFDLMKKELGVKSLEEIEKMYSIQFAPLKLITSDVKQIIGEIFKIEQENSVKIKKEFDDIKGKLKELRGSKKVSSAYLGKNRLSGSGAFFDNKK